MRRLIINADDFGLTRGVNRAILEAHEHGVVTSATLMANGAEFDQAVRCAQTAPGLSVGCHVVLLDGAPRLGASQVPSLVVNPGMPAAHFHTSWSSFAVAAIGGRLNPNEIEAEAVEQIRRLQAAGIVVSHLDTHKHTHIFPQVLQPLLQAARTCGVNAVRNPFESPRWGTPAGRLNLWKRWAGTTVLHGFAGSFQRTVKAAGMHTPNQAVGIIATGSLDPPLLSAMLKTLPEGTSELICHPGYMDEQLAQVQTRLRKSREQELQALTSPEIRECLDRNHIALISYRELA